MTQADNPPRRLNELIRRQLDEELSENEFIEFSQLLRDNPQAIDEYLKIVSLEADLEWEFLRSPVEPYDGMPIYSPQPAPVGHALPERRLARRRVFALALVAVAATVAIAAFFQWSERDTVAAAEPVVAHIKGSVVLTSNDRKTSVAEAGNRIEDGATVRTKGNESFAVVAYDDGSQILLTGDSAVEFGNQQGNARVSVSNGTIAASVTRRRAGWPFIFNTPQARIDVLGTQFSIATTSKKTDLKVSAGSVKLTRSADGESIVVAQGKRVSADDSSRLVAEDNESPADSWHETFEKGSVSGWLLGEFVANDLPTGSRGAIKAAFSKNPLSPIYGISSPHSWIDGLFVIHPDTHLNITYKMESPDWINIFFITRTSDPANPQTFLHKFGSLPTHPSNANKWQTARIPLSSFQRRTNLEFGDDPPKVGELVFGISWTAPEPDRGLVIDRVSVTRGGPGIVTIKESP